MPANPTHHLGAGALWGANGRRSAAAAAALVALVALSSVLVGCQARPRTIVIDDFEPGALTGWQAVAGGSGAGSWTPTATSHPTPPTAIPTPPFESPIHPRAGSPRSPTSTAPAPAIPHPDLRLEAAAASSCASSTPGPPRSAARRLWPMTPPEANQQFRIDLRPAAPIDSVAKDDALVNIFGTSPDDPARRQPTEVRGDLSAWAGRPARLRLAPPTTEVRCGSGWTTSGSGASAGGAEGRVELLATPLATPRPSSAVDLVLHRLPQAQAPAALANPCQGSAPGR